MSMVTRWLQRGALASSVLLCVFAATAYVFRPDSLAGLTFWPVWLWAFFGIWLAVLGFSRGRHRAFGAVLLLWVIYLATFAEEPRSLVTRRRWSAEGWEAARKNGDALRVVSLNCGVGNQNAAAEVAAYKPDIVLFQEAPTAKSIRILARKLYGGHMGVAIGRDTSIVAGSTILPHSISHADYFTEARLRLRSGRQISVFSAHLSPPIFRTDPWRIGYWKDYSRKRTEQRAEMRALAARIEDQPAGSLVIAGGDFNAPAGDAIFRLLRPRLLDAFSIGGVGWGDTAVNEAPVSRIDQIWTSRDLRVAAVVVKRTLHSDHRMVICDLYMPGKR